MTTKAVGIHRARMYIEACFIEQESYLFYLELWQTLSRRYGFAVHAYYSESALFFCRIIFNMHQVSKPQYHANHYTNKCNQ